MRLRRKVVGEGLIAMNEHGATGAVNVQCSTLDAGVDGLRGDPL